MSEAKSGSAFMSAARIMGMRQEPPVSTMVWGLGSWGSLSRERAFSVI